MSSEQLTAFERLKSCLAKMITLAFPSPDAQCLQAAIGAGLNQGEYDHRKPLGFFSKALQPTEQGYSTLERESLVAYHSVKYFRFHGPQAAIFRDVLTHLYIHRE